MERPGTKVKVLSTRTNGGFSSDTDKARVYIAQLTHIIGTWV